MRINEVYANSIIWFVCTYLKWAILSRILHLCYINFTFAVAEIFCMLVVFFHFIYLISLKKIECWGQVLCCWLLFVLPRTYTVHWQIQINPKHSKLTVSCISVAISTHKLISPAICLVIWNTCAYKWEFPTFCWAIGLLQIWYLTSTGINIHHVLVIK